MTAVYASTSPTWFSALSALKPRPAEVAFWRPSNVQAREIEVGEPWFFKEWGAPQLLGFGRFVEYERTTPQTIWKRFGLASGASSLAMLVADITAARRKPTSPETAIGNVVLSDFTSFDDPLHLTDARLENLTVPFRYVPLGSHVLALAAPTPRAIGSPISASRRELATEIFARNAGNVAYIRDIYRGVCQVTGSPVLSGIGGDLTQVHHIDFLYQGGSDDPSNMMSLCPDWHALAHSSATTFEWATLEFVVGGARYGLRVNKHLRPK